MVSIEGLEFRMSAFYSIVKHAEAPITTTYGQHYVICRAFRATPLRSPEASSLAFWDALPRE